ncbi:unnamed protein product [Fraxinus pennsylvanica]|uniref:Uncharacterized protein n=1 Tax=Fraxinus pennsylvanica TaxID=56036 RepID=A0AAD1ZKD3_9LAMI|nr:unnamed protein product [Fraxinus pennsylvanica]
MPRFPIKQHHDPHLIFPSDFFLPEATESPKSRRHLCATCVLDADKWTLIARRLEEGLENLQVLWILLVTTEIRKGEGMQLSQLIQDTSLPRESNVRIQPFDLDVLRDAFQLRETARIDLPISEKGTPTIAGKSKNEFKDKEKKHKKHKDKEKEKDKDKEHKKHKHRHKDRSEDKDKEKKKDRSGHHDSGAEHSKKHHEKKRKHDGDDDTNDVHKHKKSKHKSSKIDEMGAVKGSFIHCCRIIQEFSMNFLKFAKKLNSLAIHLLSKI